MRKLIHNLHSAALLGILTLAAGCISTNSPLVKAAHDGDLAIVRELVERGEQVNVQDCHVGFSYVCCTPVTCAANENHTEIVKFLCGHGADINTVDASGHFFPGNTRWSLLHYAALRGNLDLTYYLLSKGANISATTSMGMTPLKFAELGGHAEIQNLLSAKLKQKYELAVEESRSDTYTGSNRKTFLSYDMLDALPVASVTLPIDGLWTLNQGRFRIASGRMFFVNDVPGVALATMVTIKEIRQTGPRSYSLRGFVAYQGKSAYIPGEFQVLSDRALLLTIPPAPAYGLPNGYTETYTRDRLDNETLYAAQLSLPAGTITGTTHASTAPNFSASVDENAVAVVIGIQKYQALPVADFAAGDAALVRDYLRAMGYQDRNIEFLTDERATYSAIRKALETWLPKRVNAASRVTVYYAGHGAPELASGEAYIVPFDGDPNYLTDTGYPLKRLYEKLDSLPARQVVVLVDACFSGAGGRGVLAQGARSLVRLEKAAPRGERIAVLTSTQGTQISTSSSEKRQGLFTYYLLQAFREGKRDLASIYTFLKPRVEDEAKRMNVEQTPSLSPDNAAVTGRFRLW